jgi:hypothetical protein
MIRIKRTLPVRRLTVTRRGVRSSKDTGWSAAEGCPVQDSLRDLDEVDEIAADTSAIDASKAVRTRRRRQFVLILGD